MKYFIDTEFIEGFYKPLFGKRRHFIDLISIGIVDESGHEYYAISKDFDLKAVWNKYDLNYGSGDQRNLPPKKAYWLRENVLKPIWDDFRHGFNPVKHDIFDMHLSRFTYDNFKTLLKKYGKSNKQIAEEIIEFIYAGVFENFKGAEKEFHSRTKEYGWDIEPVEFYGYYADYDWVLFCSLFGRMIDLPTGFPMYCRDLKQTLDEKVKERRSTLYASCQFPKIATFNEALKSFNLPKLTNEHNALADAKWNKELYNFLTNL